MPKKHVQNFVSFLREQGVIGLAIGFLLGGSISKLVSSFINDIINPVLGLILGFTQNLSSASLKLGSAQLMYGQFLTTLIDFLVVAAVVYFGFKLLGVEKIDKKKE